MVQGHRRLLIKSKVARQAMRWVRLDGVAIAAAQGQAKRWRIPQMPPDQSRRSHGILCAVDDMTPAAGLVTSQAHKPDAAPNEKPINMNIYLDHPVMFLSIFTLWPSEFKHLYTNYIKKRKSIELSRNTWTPIGQTKFFGCNDDWCIDSLLW